MTERHFFLCAVVVYGMCALHAVFLYRKGFRKHEWFSYLLLLLGFCFHTTAMLKRGFLLHKCPVHNLYEGTTFTLWSIVAAYLVFGLWSRLRFVGAFAAPVLFGMGVFALMPKLDPPHGPQPEFVGGWISAHATLSLLSYGAFGIAAVAALMYLTQEHDLKFHKLRAIFSLLPAIQRLELITNRVVVVGLVLLTAGLFVGGHLPRPQGVVYFKDTKVLWSILLWVLYAGLLAARWRLGWFGRRFAYGAIGNFVFVLLTFWVTNLLSTIHQRA